ncbi:hypothetical protein UY3_16173 [Chelonia mydas]|uniref:Myb/SANT-like DNA-binding domain-containing protein n=1 Tax=Chelonia mydas TaxID=8469 RepID=M7B3T7_CHEMY|nr:hypothetical protein UY3_16173 [Chelonia mydas]
MVRTGHTGSDHCMGRRIRAGRTPLQKTKCQYICAKISKGMMDRGYNRDTQQCRMKIKESRQAYQKTKEANARSGSEPHTCRFYDELHAVLRGAPTTTPPLSVDT